MEGNPAPPGIYINLANNGINYQPQLVNAGFLNHQQYGSFSYVGVSKNRDTPKWMVYNGKPY